MENVEKDIQSQKKSIFGKKQEEFNKKVSSGKVGRRSLISGQSGGIGYYKDPM